MLKKKKEKKESPNTNDESMTRLDELQVSLPFINFIVLESLAVIQNLIIERLHDNLELKI